MISSIVNHAGIRAAIANCGQMWVAGESAESAAAPKQGGARETGINSGTRCKSETREIEPRPAVRKFEIEPSCPINKSAESAVAQNGSELIRGREPRINLAKFPNPRKAADPHSTISRARYTRLYSRYRVEALAISRSRSTQDPRVPILTQPQ